MSKLEESIGFYRKMSELQEKLRRSEEERLQLEERFSLLMRACRDEEEVRLNNLRERYEAFLEEEKHRKERNDRILQTLDRIESRAAILTAKSDRLKLLRKHYEVYMLRMYPGWKYVNNRLIETPLPAQTLHSKLDSESDRNVLYTPSSFSADIPSYHHNYPSVHAVNQTPSQPVPSGHPYTHVTNQHLPYASQPYPYPAADQILPSASHPYTTVNYPSSSVQPYPTSVSQSTLVAGITPIGRHTYPSIQPYPVSGVAPNTQQSLPVPAGVASQPHVIPGVSPQFVVPGITQPVSEVKVPLETARIVDINSTQVKPNIDMKQQETRLLSNQDGDSREENQLKKMEQIDGYLGRAAEMLKMNGVDRSDDKSVFQNLSEVVPQSLKDKHLGNSIDIEVEQNTSGDVLNVTLSDDGILQDEPSKTLVSPTHIQLTDVEILEKASHEEHGGGDVAVASGGFDNQQEDVEEAKLRGAGDSFIPERDHVARVEEQGKSSHVQYEVKETAQDVTNGDDVGKTQEETCLESSNQYAEQEQWDENAAAQYYQQDGQYYQYGDEMYQQEYAEGEYDQQYDQQYDEYNQQYTEEEYQEYQKHLQQQQQDVGDQSPALPPQQEVGESDALQPEQVEELQRSESKQQEESEMQPGNGGDSASSRDDVKLDAQLEQPQLSSDVTDPSLSSEKVEQYCQLLGVPAAGEPETSDTDELEAQLAALVDTKQDGDKEKEEPAQAVITEQKQHPPHVVTSEQKTIEPTAEELTTSSEPAVVAVKPVVVQKTSRPVSKKLPDLNKVLESDSESLQLDATVSNAESDDFDFSEK